VSLANEFEQMAVKEGEQQRANMIAVGVGVHQQTDL
jgi:hypothetical protein